MNYNTVETKNKTNRYKSWVIKRRTTGSEANARKAKKLAIFIKAYEMGRITSSVLSDAFLQIYNMR